MIRVGFVVGEYPPEERKRRIDVALSYASTEIEIGIIPAAATSYRHGLTPAEVQFAAPAFIEAFCQAERQGYHAVVPLGALDLGVEGGKSAVDIPVVGPTEAALHIAGIVGERVGVLIYHEKLLPVARAVIRRYGMEALIAGYRFSGFDLPDIAANREALIENFLVRARELIRDEGADVIYPMGATQCPVHMKPLWLQEQLGVPVVEGIGAPIRVAALIVNLGLRQSRVRWPKTVIP
jgi:allantoin racemase